MPKAWRDLCENPDELLLELLAEKVESLCGHRPGDDAVAQFLGRLAAQTVAPEVPPTLRPTPRRLPTIAEVPSSTTAFWTFRAPVACEFKGVRRQVASFKEILLFVAETLCRDHAPDFQRVETLRGRKRAYFSRDYKGMTAPAQIPGSEYYAETCLSAENIRVRCHELLALFGYAAGDLRVELRPQQDGA